MSEKQTWRSLLGEIIRSPHERQRMAEALGVNPLTLTCWIENTSSPRPDSLHRLLHILPIQQDVFRALVVEEFPDLFADEGELETKPDMISSAFYAQVVEALVETPEQIRFWSVCNLVLNQIMKHFDSSGRSTIVLFLQCFPPSRGSCVRSLRARAGAGVPPWGGRTDPYNVLLGAESFAGAVLASGRPALAQSREDYGRMPVPENAQIASELACPVQRAGRLAGCLYACSSQAHAFLASHLTLLQEYAKLIALVLSPEDFYEPHNICLHIMPPIQVQMPSLSNFSRYVIQVRREAASQQPLSAVQAEQMVYQRLEEEFIQLMFTFTSRSRPEGHAF